MTSLIKPMLAIAFLCPATQAIEYQLDQTNSHSSASMVNSIYVGSRNLIKSSATNGIPFTLNSETEMHDAVSLSSASQSASFQCTIANGIGNPVFHQSPLNWPVPVDLSMLVSLDTKGHKMDGNFVDSEGMLETMAAGYAFDLNSQASIWWKLLPDPKATNEYTAMPVKVLVWADYNLGGSSSNTSSKGRNGILNLNINDGRIGPFYCYSETSMADFHFNRWLGPDPLSSSSVLLPLGEELRLDYNYQAHVMNLAGGPESYWSNEKDADLYVCFTSSKAKLVYCADKSAFLDSLGGKPPEPANLNEMQNHLLDSVPRTIWARAVFLAVPLEVFKIPSLLGLTDPQGSIELSLKDPQYGFLVAKGKDTANDGYVDSPRIIDDVFLQTWVVSESSMSDPSRAKVNIEVRIDTNNDKVVDQLFVDQIDLHTVDVKLIDYDADKVPCKIKINPTTGEPELKCDSQWVVFTVRITVGGVIIIEPKFLEIESKSSAAESWRPVTQSIQTPIPDDGIRVKVLRDPIFQPELFRAKVILPSVIPQFAP
jgi:hypothetical protein